MKTRFSLTHLTFFLMMAFMNIGCCGLRKSCTAVGEPRPTPVESSFIKRSFSIQKRNWTVYEKGGDGPAVLLLHELPGLTCGTLCLADELASGPHRCRVYAPLLFGKYGQDAGVKESFAFLLFRSWGSRWNVQSTRSLGTIVDEVAELCRQIQRENQGRPVIVIGNCLTGPWAVSLLAEPSVAGSIVCQPAVPVLPLLLAQKKSLGIPPARLQTLAKQGKKCLGFRYLHDNTADVAMRLRFQQLHDVFGDNFTAHVLATSEDKEQVPGFAKSLKAGCSSGHSTLTGNAALQHSTERAALLEITQDFIGTHGANR